jgi:hypothetical protein
MEPLPYGRGSVKLYKPLPYGRGSVRLYKPLPYGRGSVRLYKPLPYGRGSVKLYKPLPTVTAQKRSGSGFVLNAQSCHLPLAGQLKIKNRLGHKNCREDVRDQTDHQRYSESLHGPGTKNK